jgi:hypothetical protein
MPYVTDHPRLGPVHEAIHAFEFHSSGDLNFVITTAVAAYLEQHPHRYAAMNDVTGALFNAAQEFDRRVVVPYEAAKAADPANADPYANVARA